MNDTMLRVILIGLCVGQVIQGFAVLMLIRAFYRLDSLVYADRMMQIKWNMMNAGVKREPDGSYEDYR